MISLEERPRNAPRERRAASHRMVQVRQAVEWLIRTIDETDRARRGELLKDVPEAELYEAAVNAVMRLVSLLATQEFGPLGDPLSDRKFAPSTVVSSVRKLPSTKPNGDGDAWKRLLGSVLNNKQTATSLLGLLQPIVTQQETSESDRCLFTAEQLGHIYEGLLDQTVKRADDHVLGFVGCKGTEPTIELSRLELLRKQGTPELLKFLKTTTGRSYPALRRALETPVEDGEQKLKAACGSDKKLFNRMRPFAGLMRNDSLGLPLVIHAGNLFVAEGSERRSTGSHYTPTKLTQPIVRHTLEPLVYEGVAEGLPPEKWTLRSAKQLLDLKICDMACGAGAFLLEACRYLSERLLEAWETAERLHPRIPCVLPYGDATTGVPNEVCIPEAIDARRIESRRLVAQRCLYGVDKSPQAIEVAKLSFRLLTNSRDQPPVFLDHCLRCGDSLVGISRVEQIKQRETQSNRLSVAANLRKAIQEQPRDTLQTVRRQRSRLIKIEPQTRSLKHAADQIVAADWPITQQCEDRMPATFHWPLEFPEVFVSREGFDAVVGNPPFINAIEGGLSASYKTWLARQPHHLTGTADLAFHFLARADQLTRPSGSVGLLMPRPFLNAPAGSELRSQLMVSRPPAVLFSPAESATFAFANVKVVAVVLFNRSDRSCTSVLQGKPRAIDIRSANWWSAVASESSASRATGRRSGQRVADVFEVAASMTTGNAYDLKPIVHDRADTNWPRLVTTGLIDPDKCLWGEVVCRYLKSNYGHPVISSSQRSSADLRRRLSTAKRPKILVAGVAGPGGGLEAFVDDCGLTCGAVSTYTITHPADSIPALQSLCRFLNSPAVTAQVFSELHASSMGSGLLTIKKAFLSGLSLPNKLARSTAAAHHQVIPDGLF